MTRSNGHSSGRLPGWLIIAAFLTTFRAAAAHNGIAQPPRGDILRNGGFEGGSGSDGNGAGIPEWAAFGSGYDIDRTSAHGGDQCIRSDSLRNNASHGAVAEITLNQVRATPIEVSAWSKADRVSGSKDGDYSVYADLVYTDGTPLWGQYAAFTVGTHDWQHRRLLIAPKKPVKTLRVYALFRSHSGTAWFDDFSAHQLDGAGIFDSQALLPLPLREIRRPADAATTVVSGDGLALQMTGEADITGIKSGGQQVSSGERGGFFLRDVAAEGPLVALRGPAHSYRKTGVDFTCTPENLGIRFYARIVPHGNALDVDGEVTDVTNHDRAVTVYLTIPVGGPGWSWGQDIRTSETIGAGHEYANLTNVNVGANGGLSLYPFGCVSNAANGVAIASQMDWPSVYRIFYNGTARQLVIAWDYGLTGRTGAWPPHNARFRCTLFRLPAGQARWGFRAAAARFYQLNAPNFNRLAKKDGIWMPFTDPSHVLHAEDFGFAFHEGDNSLKSDDAMGITSFRYTEPMTWWMVMPKGMPRTYDDAIGLLNRLAAQPQMTDQARFARATLNCGTQDESGRFNLEFQNTPWADGAVFVLDPNPDITASSAHPTKAFLSYTFDLATKMYSPAAIRERGNQGGEYLDSLEGWADSQDYRPSNIQSCPYPIPFDTDSRVPTLPQWYSTHAFARFLRDDLHNRGKLLMANTTPVRFSINSPLFDVAGIEVNWLGPDGNWNPDTDAIFNLRRTMSAQKPYCLLMNTDFDRFTSVMVEKYFQRSMFYGVFPSMFSVNASDKPYWENPNWYNRDRPLFKRYIPAIQKLSHAGWATITYASGSPNLWVERFGPRMFTVMNGGVGAITGTLSIETGPLGMPAGLNVHDLVTGAIYPSRRTGGNLNVIFSLKAGDAHALEVR